MGTSATPTQNQAEPLSAIERLTNVFFEPSKTFKDLNRDNSWWLPWLLIAASAVLFAFAVQQKIGFDHVAENMLQMSPKQMARLENASPEQRDRALEMNGKVTMYRAYARPVLGLLFAAIYAGILLGVFNFGMGTEVSFSTAMAVVMYGALPNLLKNLISVLTLFLGYNPDGFLMDNPLGSNIGFYIDPTKHILLYSLGSAVDLFAIWSLILVGIGMSCVSKVRTSTAISAVVGIFCFFALVGTGIAALLL